jgi:hypothetical protein
MKSLCPLAVAFLAVFQYPLLTSAAAIEARSEWVYAGCFNEPTKGYVLASKRGTSAGMTLSACASFCTSYLVYGVENGNLVRPLSPSLLHSLH